MHVNMQIAMLKEAQSLYNLDVFKNATSNRESVPLIDPEVK